MVLTSVDGRKIDLFSEQNDPYPGSMSDADILIDLLENNKELATFLQPGDVAVLDRGLRNAIKKLKDNYNIDV